VGGDGHVESGAGHKGRQKMAASAFRWGGQRRQKRLRSNPVLASDLANFMTGEIINVNGGRCFAIKFAISGCAAA